MTKPDPQPVTRHDLEMDLEHLTEEQELLRNTLRMQMWSLGEQIRRIRRMLQEMET